MRQPPRLPSPQAPKPPSPPSPQAPPPNPPRLEVQPQLLKHLRLYGDQLLVQRLGLLRRAHHKHLHLAELVHAVEALACGGGAPAGVNDTGSRGEGRAGTLGFEGGPRRPLR